MKHLLLYIALLYTQVAKAQVPIDSLKNTCRELNRSEVHDASKQIESAKEIFHGYFKGVKLFLVTSRHLLLVDNVPTTTVHDSYGYQLYALDAATGKRVELSSTDEFNKIFGASPALNNLDKCYLYLSLVTKTKDRITDPRDYRKALTDNSVYFKDALPFYSNHGFGTLHSQNYVRRLIHAQPQINDNLARSTKSNIYIFTISETDIYRYQFLFGSKGKIEKVIRNRIS